MTQNFPRIIHERRVALRLSLSEAAKVTGLSKPHIWQMEQGRAQNPSVSTIGLLADGYRLSTASLFKAALDDWRLRGHLFATAGEVPHIPSAQAASGDSASDAAGQ